MYNIILHVLGISMLEILFYFYYIAPIESKMFYNNIINLLDNALNNNKLVIANTAIHNIIMNITDIEENELKQDYMIGKYDREITNNQLFTLSIKCWLCLLVIGFLCYFIDYFFSQYKKTRYILPNKYNDYIDYRY